MAPDEIVVQKAYRNALDALLPTKRLPINVFKDAWSNFFFFESDEVFQESFISVMIDLLNAEGAQLCCLANLGMTENDESNNNPPFKCLDRSTTPGYYRSLLRGNGPPDGWLYWVDRYVCMSDKGRWCIYCEKENDIAVIAIRTKSDTQRLTKVIKKLQASPIEQAYEAYEEGRFRFKKLTPYWLSTLVSEYSPRAR